LCRASWYGRLLALVCRPFVAWRFDFDGFLVRRIGRHRRRILAFFGDGHCLVVRAVLAEKLLPKAAPLFIPRDFEAGARILVRSAGAPRRAPAIA
jgi:hypothetical protein